MGEERGRHRRPQGEERRKAWEREGGKEEVEKRKGRGGRGRKEGAGRNRGHGSGSEPQGLDAVS